MFGVSTKVLATFLLVGMLELGPVFAGGEKGCIPTACLVMAKTAVQAACGAAAGGATAALVGDVLEQAIGLPKQKTIACGMLIGGILGGERKTVVKAAAILLGYTKRVDFDAIIAVMGAATHKNPKAMAATMLLGSLVKGDYAAALKDAVVLTGSSTAEAKEVETLLKGGKVGDFINLAAKASGLLCKGGGGKSENGNGSTTTGEGGACTLKPWALNLALGSLKNKMIEEERKLKAKVTAATSAQQDPSGSGSDHKCVSLKCLASQAAKIGCGVAGGSYIAELVALKAAAKYSRNSKNAAICGGLVGAVIGANPRLVIQAASALLGLAKSEDFDAALKLVSAAVGGDTTAGHVTQLVAAIAAGNFSAAIQLAGLVLGHTDSKTVQAATLVVPPGAVGSPGAPGGDKFVTTAQVTELYCKLPPRGTDGSESIITEENLQIAGEGCTSMKLLSSGLEYTVGL